MTFEPFCRIPIFLVEDYSIEGLYMALHIVCIYIYIYTLWLFNIAMEHGPFIDGLPIKNGDFP